MMNIQGIMKQAQMMQKKMEEAQEKLAQQEITGTSGGGLVKITLNGKFEAKKIELDKSLLVPEEVDILEDLILAAYNEAHAKVDTVYGRRNERRHRRLKFGRFKASFLRWIRRGRKRN